MARRKKRRIPKPKRSKIKTPKKSKVKTMHKTVEHVVTCKKIIEPIQDPQQMEFQNAVVPEYVLKKLLNNHLKEIITFKKHPGRSRLYSKPKRLEFLTGMVTWECLSNALGIETLLSRGIKVPCSIPTEMSDISDPIPTESVVPPLTEEVPVSDSTCVNKRPGRKLGKRKKPMNFVDPLDGDELDRRYSDDRIENSYLPDFGVRKNRQVMGIDVHKVNLVWCIVWPDGRLKEGSSANTADGIGDLIRICKTFGVNEAALESTAELRCKPAWMMMDAGMSILLANPLQVKAVQGIKTDRVDAKRIALAFRDGRLKPSVLCTQRQMLLRKTMRLLHKRVEKATECLQRTNFYVFQLDSPKWIKEWYTSNRGKRIFQKSFGLENYEEISDLIRFEFSGGKGALKSEEAIQKKAGELWNFHQGLRYHGWTELFLEELTNYLRLTEQALRAEMRAVKCIEQDERLLGYVNLLLTIPGVGVRTALSLAAEIVDISFFPGQKQLVKWAGLAPRTNQSGYKKRKNGKIFKGGNVSVRTCCFTVAANDFAHADKPGHPIGNMVKRIQINGKKPWKLAVTAGGRRLLVIIYRMLKDGKTFHQAHNIEITMNNTANYNRKKKALRLIVARSKQDQLPELLKIFQESISDFLSVDRKYSTLIKRVFKCSEKIVAKSVGPPDSNVQVQIKKMRLNFGRAKC